ncbi:hypothetical protein C1I98_29925 [Spongiactinospora gelatinilytica]|uniref:Uncharacterized protein n=1 Tax=Spongiactinospora gelatinilytica TaxID=2666298 RepID=A0A2W2FSZ5_9ACTN|nr:hypothetical protein C1I98_29925 [Spongiactinospora gelatinilytica]
MVDRRRRDRLPPDADRQRQFPGGRIQLDQVDAPAVPSPLREFDPIILDEYTDKIRHGGL